MANSRNMMMVIRLFLENGGFQLEGGFQADNKYDNMFKITLTCGKSGHQLVYTKHDYVCNCNEVFKTEEFNWNAEIHRFFRESTEDLTNDEYKTPMGPKVQEDWEVDPKTTPPMRKSSPLYIQYLHNTLHNTFSAQTSVCTLCSEKEKKITQNRLLNHQTPNIKRRNSIGTSFSPQVGKNQIPRNPQVSGISKNPLVGKSPQIRSPLAKSPAGMSLYLQPPPVKSKFNVRSLRSPQIPVRPLKSRQNLKSSPLVERNNLVSINKPQLGIVKPLKSSKMSPDPKRNWANVTFRKKEKK